ncbi:hypothetical protein [Nocardia sp. alder85J]|uniref:acyl-CoA-like ligand-binding transcription factor n=1 Tax=Nocardia sp. alder85J TaxID=2862949 RepID=UPI002101D9E4|nr:hypothetical protein [Nocardia sp. alder85J]MCX4095620.1 hypothetical protein [Nocardia sp. alder85J]
MVIKRAIAENPALVAGELERVSRMQARLVTVVRQRSGQAVDERDPRVPAVVGAALACMLAAKQAWLATGRPPAFGGLLDEAMSVLNHRSCPIPLAELTIDH